MVLLITPVDVASHDSNRPRHVDDVMLYIGTLISVYSVAVGLGVLALHAYTLKISCS